MRGPASVRFWAKVKKTDGCWLWVAAKNPDGYGAFYTRERTVLAHRYSYTELVGPIPEGLTIDHLCRTPACVNPAHLEAVTNRENSMRGFTVAAINARKTHCDRGHKYTSADTYVNPRTGRRQCRPCVRLWWHSTRARREQQAAA